jgi:hypothetical protein
MTFRDLLKATTSSLAFVALAGAAQGADFNVPAGDLKAALDAYAHQSGVALVVSSAEVRGARTKGLKGNLSPDAALSRILEGTGFNVYKYSSGAVGISREKASEDTSSVILQSLQLAQAAPAQRSAVETVTVTS